jgi:hypothetical protein
MTGAIILLRRYALMASTGRNLLFDLTVKAGLVLREVETKLCKEKAT